METSKNLTRQITLDELISSQEGSPANPTALQANERAKKMTDTSGRKCCALYASVHPVGSWEKMFADLLVGMEGWYSKRCALTWKLKGTPYNRSYFQLAVSVLPTDEIESGLLPTPTKNRQPQRRPNERGEKGERRTPSKRGANRLNAEDRHTNNPQHQLTPSTQPTQRGCDTNRSEATEGYADLCNARSGNVGRLPICRPSLWRR